MEKVKRTYRASAVLEKQYRDIVCFGQTTVQVCEEFRDGRSVVYCMFEVEACDEHLLALVKAGLTFTRYNKTYYFRVEWNDVFSLDAGQEEK